MGITILSNIQACQYLYLPCFCALPFCNHSHDMSSKPDLDKSFWFRFQNSDRVFGYSGLDELLSVYLQWNLALLLGWADFLHVSMTCDMKYSKIVLFFILTMLVEVNMDYGMLTHFFPVNVEFVMPLISHILDIQDSRSHNIKRLSSL